MNALLFEGCDTATNLNNKNKMINMIVSQSEEKRAYWIFKSVFFPSNLKMSIRISFRPRLN